MNFVDDEEIKNAQTTKKDKKPIIAVILLVAIFIVAILIVVTYATLVKMKGKELTISLNGNNNAELKKIIQIEDDGTMYVPIRDIAEYLNYKSYNGNYRNKSENSDECYIETKEEIVTFVDGAEEIEKINPSNSETTYFRLEKPIKTKNNKLYISSDGFEIAYNVKCEYDKSKNKISIKTMDYIIEENKAEILKNGFKSISNKFDDKKAVLTGLAIVTGDSGKYGLYNFYNQETILETKYDNIEYVPVTGDFTIKSNGNVGIKTSDGRDKIQTRYESIEFVGQKFKLYVVKKNNKYGIIDNSESTIIPIIYDKIGIDASAFIKNGIKNKYVVANKLIPVMQNKNWALFDLNGIQLTDFVYQGIGSTNSSSGENLLIIPDYNVFVVAKDKKYILMDDEAKEIWNGKIFDQIYLQFQDGKPLYKLVTNNKTYDALTYLGKTLGNKNDDSENVENVEEVKEEETKTPDSKQNENKNNTKSGENKEEDNNDSETEIMEQENTEENNEEDNSDEENNEENNDENSDENSDQE
ncbi:MAG: hypothetical protein J6I85_06795 [Clostridia bacterium]|nr:hypothetical protein [Clostridia bacterium]